MKVRPALGLVTAIMLPSVYATGAAAGVPTPPPQICVNGKCLASQASASGQIKWHPGHYMMSDEMDRSSSGQIASKRYEQSVCATSGQNVQGWVGNYTWAILEPTQGSYDFSHIDADLAALGGTCKRLIIQVTSTLYGSSNVSGVVPQYIQNSSAFGPSPVGGQYGYWTETGGTTITTAIWRPVVMARWAALFAALGARYDSNPLVEAIGVDNETVDGDNLDPGNDFSKPAMESQWVTLEQTAVAAMPHTSFILQINYVAPGIQETANVLQAAYANRTAFGGPDLFGASSDTNNPTELWAVGVYIGEGYLNGGNSGAITTPGTDYRGKMACFHDVQSPELAGGMGLKQYTPTDIFNEANNNMHCDHILWNYWPQPGNTGDWTTGVLPMINSNPVTYKSCPTSYTAGCNTN